MTSFAKVHQLREVDFPKLSRRQQRARVDARTRQQSYETLITLTRVQRLGKVLGTHGNQAVKAIVGGP